MDNLKIKKRRKIQELMMRAMLFDGLNIKLDFNVANEELPDELA